MYYTKRDIEFTSSGIYLRSENKYFSGYTGATRIISYGEEPFRDKMIRLHGPEKAQEILSRTQTRGNKIHEQLEQDYATMLPSEVLDVLGEQIDYELFVFGECFGINALGFIDALYKKDGSFIIVDYKTKSKPYAGLDLTQYWMQMVIYTILFSKMYSIEAKSIKMATVLIYTDGSPVEVHVLDNLLKTRNIAQSVLSKCRLIRES